MDRETLDAGDPTERVTIAPPAEAETDPPPAADSAAWDDRPTNADFDLHRGTRGMSVPQQVDLAALDRAKRRVG